VQRPRQDIREGSRAAHIGVRVSRISAAGAHLGAATPRRGRCVGWAVMMRSIGRQHPTAGDFASAEPGLPSHRSMNCHRPR
jgi:hypothetical protein